MTIDLSPGRPFPDIELDDHAGNRRRLSELVGGDPVVLQFFRGWWCPKEQALLPPPDRVCRTRRRSPTRASCPSASTRPRSRPPSAPGSARDGRSCPTPTAPSQAELGLRETTDTLNDPYVPAVFTLFPDLHHPPRLRRLLVLGPADDGGAAPRHARDHRRDPRRLGGAAPHDPLLARAARVRRRPTRPHRPGRTMPTAAPAGWLAAWRQRAKPVRAARRVDDRHRRPGRRAGLGLARPAAGRRAARVRRPRRPARAPARARRAAPGRGVHPDARLLALRRCDHGRARSRRRALARRPVRTHLPRAHPAGRAPACWARRRRLPARRSSATAAPTRGRGIASTRMRRNGPR